MADIIDNFEPQRGRPPKYNWDVWCDGKPRRLIQGNDFDATLHSFQTMVHRKARERNLKAYTKVDEPNDAIIVQFVPKA